MLLLVSYPWPLCAPTRPLPAPACCSFPPTARARCVPVPLLCAPTPPFARGRALAHLLALSACGRWRGRFLSGGGRRRAALTAPLPVALRWRSWRRLSRAAALAATWRSAAALRGGGSLSARCVVLSGSRSLRVVVGAVASSLGAVAVARRYGAAAFGAALALLAPAQACRRTRGGMALGRRSYVAAARSLGAVRRAQRLALSACGRRRGRLLSGVGRRRAALTAPLPEAPRWRSWRRLSCATAFAAA